MHYLEPRAFSPDGKWLAALEVRSAEPWTNRILLFSLESGKPHALHTRQGANPYGWSAFSPDSRWLAQTVRPREDQEAMSVSLLRVDDPSAPPAVVVERGSLVSWTPDASGLLFTRTRDGQDELFLQPLSAGKPAGDARRIDSVAELSDSPLVITTAGSLLYLKRRQTADAVLAPFGLESGRIGAPSSTNPTEIMGWRGAGGGAPFSPDGRRVVFTGRQNRLLIRSLADGSSHSIVPQMSSFTRVEWAADGNSLLLSGTGTDKRIGWFRADPQSGATTFVASPAGDVFRFNLFAVAPGGKSAYAYAQNGFLHIDLQTGSVRPVWKQSTYSPRDMRFSPDGRRLALFGSGGITIVDVASGEMRDVLSRNTSFTGGGWSPDGRFLVTTTFNSSWDFCFLLRIPVDGGEPAEFRLPVRYTGLRLSPDGKSMALIRATTHNQVWALDNFLPSSAAPKQ